MAYENTKELILHGQRVFNLAIMKVVQMDCGIKVEVISYSLTDKTLGNSLPSFKSTISSSSCCFSSFCTPFYAIITATVRHFGVQGVSPNPGHCPPQLSSHLPLPFVFSAPSSQVAAMATEIYHMYLQQFWLSLNSGFTHIWDKSALLWKKK